MLKISSTLRLLTHLRVPFSVDNYHKTFDPSQVTRFHGHFRVDQQNHFDKDPDAVSGFVKQEQQIYKAESQKWKHITEEYYRISSERRDTRLSSVPERFDDYEYFTKTAWKNNKEYTTVYRQKDKGTEELILDIMQYPYISRHGQTVELLSTSFSPSHRFIAFSVDLKNNENSMYFIAKTTGSRELLKIGDSSRSSKLENTHDLVFASQSKVFFLKSEDHRPCKLVSLDMQTGVTSELFFEKDQQFYLGLKMSKDKSFLLLSGVSKTQTKLWVISAHNQKASLLKVWQGSGKIYINHIEGYFVLWSLKNTSSIKMIRDSKISILTSKKRDSIDLSKLEGEILFTSDIEETIEDIDILKGNICLYGHRVTYPFIKVISYQQKDNSFDTKIKEVKLPFNYGSVTPCTNQNYNSDSILFSVSTPFVYEEIYSYSISKDLCEIVQKYQHTGPIINTKKYQVEVIQVPASDMNTIPLTIVGPTQRKTQKLLLQFYGCYGLPQKVEYDNVTIAALEQGWTICHAHIRGGNEKGFLWHSQSQGDNRNRAWMDIEECVGYLLREQYTHPSLLFLTSSSAGAVNLWNAISRKPYLYKAAIFRAPFLDVLSSLLDPTQPLSNTDYQQFGNPANSLKAYHQISAISPYENIANKEYPLIHITIGLNDYRTPISQVAKFVSRFRERALPNSRVQGVGMKGVTTAISETGSHIGESSIKQENMRACDIFGYMDYVIDYGSKDCRKVV